MESCVYAFTQAQYCSGREEKKFVGVRQQCVMGVPLPCCYQQAVAAIGADAACPLAHSLLCCVLLLLLLLCHAVVLFAWLTLHVLYLIQCCAVFAPSADPRISVKAKLGAGSAGEGWCARVLCCFLLGVLGLV